MPGIASYTLATGVTTTGGQPVNGVDVGSDVDEIALEINVTTAGTTATYQLEGSMDGTNWYPVDTSDSTDISTTASAATRVYTSTGRRMLFARITGIIGPGFFRLYRVNATTVTGQTYSATLFTKDPE